MRKNKNNIKRIIKKRINIINSNNIFIENNINDNKIYINQKNINDNLIVNDVDVNNISNTYDYAYIFNNKKHNTELKTLVLISNYMRIDMLTMILNEIKEYNNIDYYIFDDRSDYVLDDNRFIVNSEHRGKHQYWKTFDEMFKMCEKSNYDVYCFIPNDFLNINFSRIFKYASLLSEYYYVFNIINDGRLESWTGKKSYKISDDIYISFFTDCGFFTNRKTLEKLKFTIFPIKIKNDKMSSGVGRQLSIRLRDLKIPIFTPIKSFAYHGDHESLMNPEVRKIHKIISL